MNPECSMTSLSMGAASCTSLVHGYEQFLELTKSSKFCVPIKNVDDDVKYVEVIGQCRKTGTRYLDESFALSPLFYDRVLMMQEIELVSWYRPESLVPHDLVDQVVKWSIFNNPVAGDIVQGKSLGDCWLASALAILAEKPHLLDRVLANKELSSHGVYRVRLYHDGKLTSVIIDDQFPSDHERKTLYIWAMRKQLFVNIIEKAMAKLYGCYESLNEGQTIEGLSVLTGYPCRSMEMRPARKPKKESVSPNERLCDPDYIWASLINYQEAGFLMATGCGSNPNRPTPEEFETKGLQQVHAYSIMSVVESEFPSVPQATAAEARTIRLIQMRNPWGSKSWLGDWSDKSDLWIQAPELRQKCQPCKSEQGVFWISFEEFRKYFDTVEVCKMRQGWPECRYEGCFTSSVADTRHLVVFEVQVDEDQTVLEFTLHQESRRPKHLKMTPLLPICTAVFQMKDLEQKIGDLVEHSGYKIRTFVGCDVVVDRGVYLVTVYAFNQWQWMHKLHAKFVLSLFSSCQVTMKCWQPKDASIIRETLIELATTRGTKFIHQDKNVISYYLSEEWSGFVVVVENRHVDKYLEVTYEAPKSTHLHYTRGSSRTVDTIPPMTRQVVNIISRVTLDGVQLKTDLISSKVTSEGRIVHIPRLEDEDVLHEFQRLKPRRSPES